MAEISSFMALANPSSGNFLEEFLNHFYVGREEKIFTESFESYARRVYDATSEERGQHYLHTEPSSSVSSSDDSNDDDDDDDDDDNDDEPGKRETRTAPGRRSC
ncbi:hypothetical protein H072_7883 [Dactylellina haptotyla CBS 200.50]|uniref:Uncharacterized protein n=1 Tax=Dactylellina haptotyla (strain CBS 200.50) TaxID=1284197 RepID=S8BT71_DACHA|nr:hypothetical protein H072_7883 [Dactylellina haptotyla CBS 200.50]